MINSLFLGGSAIEFCRSMTLPAFRCHGFLLLDDRTAARRKESSATSAMLPLVVLTAACSYSLPMHHADTRGQGTSAAAFEQRLNLFPRFCCVAQPSNRSMSCVAKVDSIWVGMEHEGQGSSRRGPRCYVDMVEV